MEGRYPAAVVVVNCGQSDRSPKSEFEGWLNDTLIGGFSRTGLISGASAYLHDGFKAGETEHLVVFETNTPEDAANLARDIDLTADGTRMPAGVHLLRMHAYERIGPEFCREPGRPVTGILIVETKCLDPVQEERFNDWYNSTHVHDQLGTGCYHTAYRYKSLSKARGGDRYLAFYETDAADPDEPSDRILRYWRPKWVDEGRWSDLIEVTGRAAYKKAHDRPDVS